MTTISNEQADKLLEDIASIKSVLKQNRSIIQLIVHPRHYQLLAVLFFISIIVFSAVFHVLMIFYGDYVSISQWIKNILYVAVAVDCAILVYIKFSMMERSIIQADEKMSLSKALFDFFTFRVVHVYVPVVLLMIILIIYFSIRNMEYYIIPTITISLGLIYNFIGGLSETKRYLLSGYWMVITGILAILYTAVPAAIVLIITLGIGVLFLALPYKEE